MAWLRTHRTLEKAAASHPDARTLSGRGGVYVVPAPGQGPGNGEAGREHWVVRHYHRGGAIAPILGDRYLRIGTPRPFRELHVGRTLERRGIPTPVHIAAAVYPSGLWYRGDLVTRHVPGSRDLAAVLFPGRSLSGAAEPPEAGEAAGVAGAGKLPEVAELSEVPEAAAEATEVAEVAEAAEAAMRATGRLFRQLHDGGVVHPDLNLKNVLIRGEAGALEALALDLDGARLRREVGDAARRRMIARFWRSARKWQDATGVTLAPALEAAFDAGYDGGRAG